MGGWVGGCVCVCVCGTVTGMRLILVTVATTSYNLVVTYSEPCVPEIQYLSKQTPDSRLKKSVLPTVQLWQIEYSR